MYWGCMERLNSSTQVVSISIYGMCGAGADIGLKFHGLQEWPKLPHQQIIHELPPPKTQVLQMAPPTRIKEM